MRAVQVHAFGAPEVLVEREGVAVPTITENEVLIRVVCCGVNPVDTYIRSGVYAKLPQLPYVPGSDASGIVEQVGSKVSRFAVGDRVFVCRTKSGSYAELCACDPEQIGHLPKHVSFAQGASVGIAYLTAERALRLCGFFENPSGKVFVHGGSGGVGIATVQLARAAGAYVVATAGSDRGAAILLANGASEVLNHRTPGYLHELRDVNVCVEMLANVNLASDFTVMAPGGNIAIVGNRGEIQINPRALMTSEIRVIGISLHHTTTAEFISAIQKVQRGLEDSTLAPVVDTEFDLRDASKAHEHVIAHTNGSAGKIVLRVQGEQA
eukprot:c17635_g3_i1.p1 GENE.c17635_g3_i1~~c17635_g3_i1.p1  ORF type:complete len:324 (+),score=71.34 c17635_g3_i1:32-1003(+)